MKRMDKRGLSEVIVTLIIILLSLVAIGIVWVVVNSFISSGSTNVNLGKFTLQMKVENAVYSSNGVDVTVRRDPGKGDVSSLKFFVSDGVNVQEFQEPTAINELEEKTFHLDYYGVVKKVSVAPVFGTGSDSTTGDVVDTLEFDSKTAVKNMQGLVSWWKFETQNSDNSTSDEMGRNTMSKGVFGSYPSLTAGKFGNSYRFNAIQSFLQSFGTSDTQNNISVTYVAWINKMGAFPGDSGIVGDLPPAPTGIYIDSSNHVVFKIDGSTRYTSTKTVVNNQWTHVAGSYSNNTVKIYVNGGVENFTASSSTLSDNHGLGIGGIGIFADYPLNGTIDEVMIFNRSLSDSEVKGLYNLDLS